MQKWIVKSLSHLIHLTDVFPTETRCPMDPMDNPQIPVHIPLPTTCCQVDATQNEKSVMPVNTSFKDMLIDQLKNQMSNGHSTCPLDPMDKHNSNGHFQVHWIQWIHWALSFGYLSGLVSTWRPYACHYVIQIHVKLIEQLEKQMSDGNSTCPLDPIDKQNSNGHFQVELCKLRLF
jgi:hypothetical protein